MYNRIGIYNLVFFILIVAEILFLLYFGNINAQLPNAILYSSTSFLIGILLLIKFYNKSVSAIQTTGKKSHILFWAIPLTVFLAYSIMHQQDIIERYPVGFMQSDIIPTIKVMVKRFIQNEYVYTPFYDFGYKLNPTYLPMLWFPFSIAELTKIDYRWIPLLIWLVSIIVLQIRSSSRNTIHPILTLSLIITLFIFLSYNEATFFGYTVEIMIVAYYMLLVASINTRSVLFISISIVLCLLSRFSLLLWLPLWCAVMFIAGNKKMMLQIVAIVTTLIVAMYIIPFMTKDWHIFTNAMDTYTNAAVGEWEHIDKYTGKPMHLYKGVGFAHLFNENIQNWDTLDKVKRLQKIHFILCLAVTLAMGIWYWFNWNKIEMRIFLMASFKIYLTIFLAFIQVPYIYLMVVANFVSIAIFSEQLRYKMINTAS